MKQSAYTSARDQHIADEYSDEDRALMCSAKGCPRKWSVQGDRGKACSAHYWADPQQWPRITDDLLREDVDRARQFERPEPPPVLTRGDKQAILRKLGSVGRQGAAPSDPKAWARRLHEKHQRGEHLTEAQVAAYTTALGYAALHPYTDEEVAP